MVCAIQADVQVCYSWWDLAALSILGRLHWINKDSLISFILGAQVRLAQYLSLHLLPSSFSSFRHF